MNFSCKKVIENHFHGTQCLIWIYASVQVFWIYFININFSLPRVVLCYPMVCMFCFKGIVDYTYTYTMLTVSKLIDYYINSQLMGLNAFDNSKMVVTCYKVTCLPCFFNPRDSQPFEVLGIWSYSAPNYAN